MNAYPKYKDSGIEWIGEIPEEWAIKKINHSFRIIGSGTTPNTDKPEYYDNGTIYWVNTGDLNNGILNNTSKKVTQLALDNTGLRIYKAGSLVIAMYGATIGKISKLLIDAATNQACCVINESEVFEIDFVFYWLLVNKKHIISLAYGGGQPNISQELVKSLRLPCPAIKEQKEIISFLNIKTTQIDSLIFKKQKMIELLEEEKTAIINEAVTNGLNTNVELKDSRIEWLGMIPKHWEVKKLKFIGRLQNGISAGSEYFGKGNTFITYGDVYKNFSLPMVGSGLANSSESDRVVYSVKKGDVFFTRTSETIEEIGFASTCLETIENATFSGFLIRFRPIIGILHENFSKYYFRATINRRFFVEEMNLVTRASLSQDLLKRLPVVIPPIKEQIVISTKIDNLVERNHQIIKKIQKEIALLQEYKTVLISEAVTGKIDVRNYKEEPKMVSEYNHG